MKRAGIISSICVPLALVAMPALAQPQMQPTQPPGQPAQRAGRPVAPHPRDASRLQMSIMEDALQRAVETAHSHAVESAQLAVGMPALFAMEGNTRVRGFRLDGYGVFFDVDLPPIPKTIEWQLELGQDSVLAADLDRLEQQLQRINDPGKVRALEIIRRLQASVAPGTVASSGQPEPRNVAEERRLASPSPFAGYIADIKQTLKEIILQYGINVPLGNDDWLHVAAREMSPKLLPGNPTEATITLRIKGSDLAGFKAGRLTLEDAASRVEIREVLY